MDPITAFSGRLAPLPVDNVDTDQIIPARFLKVTDKAGLGDALFFDWRHDAAGGMRDDFPLNDESYRGAVILVAGGNFGCGSSREHAPWALLGAGFRAVVSTDFADIFRNNSLKNGLLPVAVDKAVRDELMCLAQAEPDSEVSLDLRSRTITLPDGRSFRFPIDGFARHCLLEGVDELGYLMGMETSISAFERGNLPKVDTSI